MNQETQTTVVVKQNNNIRIDKNIAENGLDWKSIYGDDWELCLDIIIYIFYKDQKEIFESGFIDQNKFSQELGYKKENLQRILAEPEHKMSNTLVFDQLPRDKKFVTKFENALFKLGKYNIPLNTVYYDETKSEYISNTKFLQVFKEVNIHISAKDRNKFYYSFTKSNELDYNISRYFFLANYDVIKEIKKKNALLLFYYLKNIENFKYPTFKEANFEKLYKLAELELNKNRPANTKLRLKEKLNFLKNFINYEFDEYNASGRYNYGFQFTFPDNFITLEERKFNDNSVLEQAFVDYVDLKVLEFYKAIFKIKTRFDETKYRSWFFDNNQNFEQKKDIYFSAYALLNKEKINSVRIKCEKQAVQFFTRKN